jgi:hypothetical protein
MDIDLKQFAALQKNSKNSFFQQKKLMQQVMMGKTVLCTECKQALKLLTPREGASEQSEHIGISCVKGCTNIALDFV